MTKKQLRCTFACLPGLAGIVFLVACRGEIPVHDRGVWLLIYCIVGYGVLQSAIFLALELTRPKFKPPSGRIDEHTDTEIADALAEHLEGLPDFDKKGLFMGGANYSPAELASLLKQREDPAFSQYVKMARSAARTLNIDVLQFIQRRQASAT